MANDTTIRLPTVVLLSILGVTTAGGVKYAWETDEPSAFVAEETQKQAALRARVVVLENEVSHLQKENKRKQDEIQMIKAKMELAKLDLIPNKTPEQDRAYAAHSRMVLDITVELERDK